MPWSAQLFSNLLHIYSVFWFSETQYVNTPPENNLVTLPSWSLFPHQCGGRSQTQCWCWHGKAVVGLIRPSPVCCIRVMFYQGM